MFPFLGHGIGLRTVHYPEIFDGAGSLDERLHGVDWFEIISENFFRPGGNPRRVLRTLRERMPIVMHGVSLSLGATDALHAGYLDELARLEQDVQPALVSDHLCWSGHAGKFAHDLLPLPFTEEALDHVADRVARVQDRLGRRILVENVSSYLAFTHSTLTEWEFLTELCRKADCGLLLDVNNIFVSAHNHAFDARTFIAGVPADRVAQIHLAGHSTRGALLLDTHDHAVRPEVWELYRFALERTGPVSTLIEWDDKIPPLADVVAESRKAAAILDEVKQAHATAATVPPRASVHATQGAQPDPQSDPPTLHKVEDRLWSLITARDTVPDTLKARGLHPEYVTSFVKGDEKLDSVGRVDVYNSMYFLRLLDLLREDFPATAGVLGGDGDDRFYDLAADFLEALPPEKPTARDVGERLPAFLKYWVGGHGAPVWLPELARLEWAIADVFDDPDARSLGAEDVEDIPPEQVADLGLRLVPAHRLLECAFPVQDVWRAIVKNQAKGAEVGTPARTPTSLLVWRRDLHINHRALPTDEAGAVAELARGMTFGRLCDRLGETLDEERAARQAIAWLGQWIGDGWLAAPPATGR